jgi:4-aminobutyrate aminotransferase-like enzyme
VAHVGHGHPRVVEAVQEQISKLNTNTRYLHPNVSLLAKRLVERLDPPLEVVFFVNSGSEANDLALRLARAYTQSKNTIVVDGAYHGHTLATLEVSPYKYEHSKEFTLQSQATSEFQTPGHHIFKVPSPDIFRGKHRDPETAGTEYAKYVKDACEYYAATCNEKVGAFFIEGGMSVAGVILPPRGYLKQSVDAVWAAGGVYIADEVQTGFGRLGSCQWAFQNNNHDKRGSVVPDIVTVGKPFGNGMPLGAVITTRKIASAFEKMQVEYFNTFGGNPVCAAAGLAMLNVLDEEDLQNHALRVGQYIKKKFRALREGGVKMIGDIRGSGLFLGIELVKDADTLEPAPLETSFLCTTLKEKYRVLTSIDGFHDNVLVVKPPMVFSETDADHFTTCFEQAYADLVALGEEGLTKMTMTPT